MLHSREAQISEFGSEEEVLSIADICMKLNNFFVVKKIKDSKANPNQFYYLCLRLFVVSHWVK